MIPIWQNAQFYIPTKRRKFWRELCRAAWYPARCQRAHKTLKFFLFRGVVFHIGFTKNGDKIILQTFSFGNMELIFAFFTKFNFGHLIFNFLFGKSYRHPISIFTVTLKVTVTRQIPLWKHFPKSGDGKSVKIRGSIFTVTTITLEQNNFFLLQIKPILSILQIGFSCDDMTIFFRKILFWYIVTS